MDDNEHHEIEILTQDLSHQLEVDLIGGLDNCENIIKADSEETPSLQFHEYLDSIQNKLKKCSCQVSWSGIKTLAVKCRTCSNDCERDEDRKGLLCLSCYLNGSHEGHDVQLVYTTSGNCCCGDPYFLKQTGFCSKHSMPDEHPELTQIDKHTRISIISSCKALLSHFIFFANYERISFDLILKWLQRLIFIGDAPRRCISIAWSDTIVLFDLYQHCLHLNNEDTQLLLAIIGSLINDATFRHYFSQSFLKNLDHFIWLNSRLTLIDINKLSSLINSDDEKTEDVPLNPVIQLFSFFNQSISNNSVIQLIQEKQLNWANIALKCITMMNQFMFSKKSNVYRLYGFLDISFKLLSLLVEIGLQQKSEQQSQDTLNFVDQFANFLRSTELSYPISRNVFGDKQDDPIKTQTIVFEYYFNMYKIVKNIGDEEITSDTPLFLLNNFFNEHLNQKTIDIDVPGSLFEHSVLQPNVTFSQIYTLHLLSYICRHKSLRETAQIVCSEDECDNFLKQWLLMPLRYLAACDLNQFDFFVRNDNETINAINSIRYKNNIMNKFSCTFSFIQDILLSHTNKEEILEMICYTYGLFLTSKSINELDEKGLLEKQIHGRLFSFVHLLCCLVFDSLCVNRDFFTMRRLTVMTHMKFTMSGMTSSQIDEVWPNHPMNDIKFFEDLLSFTQRVSSNSSGDLYKLNNDCEWHPLLPFLETGLILRAIQDFCNKNPASLVPFPEIPHHDQNRTQILFTPLLFAFEFMILNSYSHFQELVQLVLNLLVVTKNYQNEQIDQNNTKEIVAENLLDLVNQLKGVTFIQFLYTKILIKPTTNETNNQINQTELNQTTDVNNNSSQEANNQSNSNQINGNESNSNENQPNSNENQPNSNENQPNSDQQNQIPNSENQLKSDENQNQTIEKQSEASIEIHPKSIIELISELGELGSLVLKRLNLSDTMKLELIQEEKESEENKAKSHNRAAMLKMKIMSNCNEQQKSFSEANNINCVNQNVSNYECCVCHSIYSDASNSNNNFFRPVDNNILYFPCLSYKTVLPSIIETGVCTKTISLRVCIHPIHRKCVDTAQTSNPDMSFDKSFVQFQCPSDRCPRNCLLPILTTEYEPLPRNCAMLDYLSNFLNVAYGNETFIVDVVRSYATEIEFLEMRYRSNPVCLDDTANQMKLHLVYLAMWHTRSTEADYILEHDDESISPLMRYILFLISLGSLHEVNPIDVVRAVAKEITDSGKPFDVVKFIRCVFIFDYFGRNDSTIRTKATQNSSINSQTIDWDTVLAPEYLFKLYSILITPEMQRNIAENLDKILPVFDFNGLPDNFLEFMKAPYSIDISNTKDGEIAMCLFTKRLVTLPQNSQSPPRPKNNNLPSVTDFLKSVLKKTFSAFLVLNGPQASSVIICDMKANKIIKIKGFYVNKFGDEDPGLVKGHMLLLSKTKKEETIEQILSGSWTNYRIW